MKRISSWNVNGIRACVQKGFIEWLTDSDPDILAVQETKAARNQLGKEITEVQGFKSYWFSAERKGYSGVALYTKEDPLDVEPLGISEFDEEGRTLIAHYPAFTLINSYFPNSQSAGKRLGYKLAFCDAVLDRCKALVSDGKDILLCGDFNIAHTPIDLKNPKANEKNAGYLPEEREWMTTFLAAGYVDTFRDRHRNEPGHYTWWSYRFKAREKDIGWRIDYHCVNEDFKNAVKDAAIHKHVMGSDHCPVSVSLKV